MRAYYSLLRKYIAPTDTAAATAAGTYTRYLPPVKCLYASSLRCTIPTLVRPTGIEWGLNQGDVMGERWYDQRKEY